VRRGGGAHCKLGAAILSVTPPPRTSLTGVASPFLFLQLAQEPIRIIPRLQGSKRVRYTTQLSKIPFQFLILFEENSVKNNKKKTKKTG